MGLVFFVKKANDNLIIEACEMTIAGLGDCKKRSYSVKRDDVIRLKGHTHCNNEAEIQIVSLEEDVINILINGEIRQRVATEAVWLEGNYVHCNDAGTHYMLRMKR